MKKERPDLGQQIVDLLRSSGVEAIFSSPGSEWPPIWEALAGGGREGEELPAFYSTRHEEIAVPMAIGYHWRTGKLPAVIIHTAVGMLHAAMALRYARRERIPMVVMAGESSAFEEPPAPKVGPQWFADLSDIGGPAAAVAPFVKRSQHVTAPELLPGLIRDACRSAWTHPFGPVVLSVPVEHMLAAPREYSAVSPIEPWSVLPAEEDLDRVAEWLLAAEKPLILTDSIGRVPDRVPKLVRLAEALGVPVVEPSRPAYLNFPRDHPLHQGPDARTYLAEADVIVLAACFMPWQPSSHRPASARRLVLLDDYPTYDAVPYWGYDVDLCVGGDLGATLDGLARRLEAGVRNDAGLQERVRARTAACTEHHRRQRAQWQSDLEAARDRSPVDSRWLAHVLADVIGEDAVLMDETITDRPAFIRYARRNRPGTYYTRFGGGLGLGLGLSLGVKAARPETSVVTVMGDGGFQYNPALAAMGFAQEYGLPFLLILCNDGLYNSQRNSHVKFYPQGEAVRSGRFVGTSLRPLPDFCELAPAYGGLGFRVRGPEDLAETLGKAWDAYRGGRFVIVDVQTAPNPAS